MKKHFILFTIGAIIYYMIEILYRGYSHWTMALLGGIIFIILGGLNEWLTWETSLIYQGLSGTIIIYVLEYLTGLLLNVWLRWNIWDYSDKIFNIHGQVCLEMFPAWFSLALVGIVLDDIIRWGLLGEEKPRYVL